MYLFQVDFQKKIFFNEIRNNICVRIKNELKDTEDFREKKLKQAISGLRLPSLPLYLFPSHCDCGWGWWPYAD